MLAIQAFCGYAACEASALEVYWRDNFPVKFFPNNVPIFITFDNIKSYIESFPG